MYTRGVLINADTHSAEEIEFREENIREIIGCDFTGACVSRVKKGSRKEYLVLYDAVPTFISKCLTGWDSQSSKTLRGNLIVTRERMTDEDVEEVLRNVVYGIYLFRLAY